MTASWACGSTTWASTAQPTRRPAAGRGPEKPVDTLKLGWKWSLAADRGGIPTARAAAGANRNDIMLFEPTMGQIERNKLDHDIDTVHLDRGCRGTHVGRCTSGIGITDLLRPPKRTPATPGTAEPAHAPLGLRWKVERTNS